MKFNEPGRSSVKLGICVVFYLGISYASAMNIDAALMAVLVLVVVFISEERLILCNKKQYLINKLTKRVFDSEKSIGY